MSDPIAYAPTEVDAERIRALVAKGKYRNTDAVIDKALSMLLTWESKNPFGTIMIMQSMMPFTPEQEQVIKMTMKKDERMKYFGETSDESADNEAKRHEVLAISDLDHERVKDNLEEAREYLGQWSPPDTDSAYDYDGYPLLFKLYSRFLPVKITMAVLANMLYEKKSSDVSLDSLRGSAYDIAEEIAAKLASEEREWKVRRNKRVSTGLPTKAAASDKAEIEKKAHAQKRFKDQYVGRVRKDREAKVSYADGAPAALGLVTMFEEGGAQRVTLTDAGRRFCMLDNPIVRGEYKVGSSLSNEESDFIGRELLTRLPLEDAFARSAVKAVKRAGADGASTKVLDNVFSKEARIYAKKNPEKAKKFGIEGGNGGGTNARIVGWRVATMGRLAELGIVEWRVLKGGESRFLQGNRGIDSF